MKYRDYKKPVNEFAKKVIERFGAKVISIVLFGSVARGTSKKTSDVDILIVMRDLPERTIERHSLLVDMEVEFIKKYHISISPVCLSPEDFKNINPLFYGILVGYKVIYDPDNFWNNFKNRIKPEIIEQNPEYIETYENGKRWMIADII